MSKYHNDASQASDPGQISLSTERFRHLEPTARGIRGWYWRWFGDGRQFEELLDEHLQLGDSRAACVVSVEPLLVAAYTDELDCVAVLCFPDWLVEGHDLKVGSRLLTVNTYMHGEDTASDLVEGPESLKQYVNFFPVIAEFVSDDHQRIAARKKQISGKEWQRCHDMGRDYVRRFQNRWRDGSPRASFDPVL